jgi:hypothetical protein
LSLNAPGERVCEQHDPLSTMRSFDFAGAGHG